MSVPSVHDSPDGVDEKMRAITTRLSMFPGLRLEYPLPGMVVAVKKSRPWWTIVLAIVLFPIGLLFLLVRGEDRLTIQGVALPDGGSRWTVTGKAEYAVGQALRIEGVIPGGR
jgi:hypothetical protein